MGRSQNLRLHALTGAVLLAIGVVMPVQAQDDEDLRRGVARISLINGEASVRRGDSGEWVAAAVNAPLMTEDRISTGPNSRAEVQFDASNVLRIGGTAEIQLTQLESGRYQMEVAHGTITFTVLRPSGINIEVDTPSVSIKPSRQGVYRISVNDMGETQVICRAGEVEVFTPKGSQWVSSGQMLMARGTDGNPEFQVANATALDEWDRWNQSRDQALTQSSSYRHVPPGVYGVEDLDQYGDWVEADTYGSVWRPRVTSADWSPYSVGRWAWEDWYGWTWVSADPWGWAPYHYGRWFNEPRYGWCWYPGAFGARHYWSPALVAFIGFGHGGGVGFGFGNVGWVPLAPFETHNRWWGRGYSGGNFNRNINITNINVSNTYKNARVRNGISGVAESDFRSGRFNKVSRYSGDQVREAGLVRGQMPIAPTNANLRFSDREPGNSSRNSRENTRSFTQQRPNPVARTPFSQQQRNMEQGFRGQQPANDQGLRGQSAERGGGQPRNNQGVNPDSQGQNPSNGWRRFGAPSGQNQAPSSSQRTEGVFGRGAGPSRVPQANRENTRPEAPARNQAPQQNRGGWQRFGDPGAAPRQQPRQQMEQQPQQQPQPQERRSFQENPGNRRNGVQQYSPAQRGEQQSIRTAPPVVRERPASNMAPRSYESRQPSFSPQPRQEAPRQESPRQFGGGGGQPRGGGGNREMSAPRQAAPRQESPRQFGGGGGQPRGGGGGNREMSAPRSFGGGNGGGGSGPRQQSGGNSSPRNSGGENRGGGGRGHR